MRGIEFPQATTKLIPAEGDEDSVYTLPVWSDGKMVFSKWRMTWRERIKVLFTGTIWFNCWGRTHPPINLIVDFPFEKTKPKGWVIVFYALLAWAVLIGVVLLVVGTIGGVKML